MEKEMFVKQRWLGVEERKRGENKNEKIKIL